MRNHQHDTQYLRTKAHMSRTAEESMSTQSAMDALRAKLMQQAQEMAAREQRMVPHRSTTGSSTGDASSNADSGDYRGPFFTAGGRNPALAQAGIQRALHPQHMPRAFGGSFGARLHAAMLRQPPASPAAGARGVHDVRLEAGVASLWKEASLCEQLLDSDASYMSGMECMHVAQPVGDTMLCEAAKWQSVQGIPLAFDARAAALMSVPPPPPPHSEVMPEHSVSNVGVQKESRQRPASARASRANTAAVTERSFDPSNLQFSRSTDRSGRVDRAVLAREQEALREKLRAVAEREDAMDRREREEALDRRQATQEHEAALLKASIDAEQARIRTMQEQLTVHEMDLQERERALQHRLDTMHTEGRAEVAAARARQDIMSQQLLDAVTSNMLRNPPRQ